MVEVGAGMLHARSVPRLAGEGHFFPANRHKRFYRRNAEAVAEVQTIKKKENHREELERKVRDTHRMLMHDYPVYYDWWLQDGNDAKDIKDGKDVNWFRGSFSRQLSLRMQKLNITTAVNDTPESIEAAFQSYLKACERRRAERLETFTANQPEIVFTKFRTLRPSFFAYTKAFPMPVPSATTLQAVRCRRLR